MNPAGAVRLTIVMPVYNEGANIGRVLEGLHHAVHAQPFEVIVVYDFERDDTLPAVQRLKAAMPEIRLLHNALGPGVLNAIRAGFAAARGAHVLVMMADGSDDPATIDPMLALAERGADVVAASRYMAGGRQLGGPWVKRLLSRGAGLSLRLAGALPITDATSNFRLYSHRLLEAVTIESAAGFALALELTVKAQLLGLRVTETPTTWRDRTAGKSRFRLWGWLPHYLRWYRAALAGRIFPPCGQG